MDTGGYGCVRGGRVVAATGALSEVLLPPLAAALMKFTQEYEYSWHTPDIQVRTAFLNRR
jgi:lysine decarboxylase/arginine decarboxylase